MDHNLPTYAERIEAARQRLSTALDPHGPQEITALAHLYRSFGDLPATETLALMAERAVNRSRAEGYESGWTEAGGRP